MGESNQLRLGSFQCSQKLVSGIEKDHNGLLLLIFVYFEAREYNKQRQRVNNSYNYTRIYGAIKDIENAVKSGDKAVGFL